MNAKRFSSLLSLASLAMAFAGPLLAQSAPQQPQYGDRQTGRFGDISQGHFGNTAEGNFTEKQYSRRQESQIKPVDAQARPLSVKPAKPSTATDSPYVVLPKPVDAR